MIQVRVETPTGKEKFSGEINGQTVDQFQQDFDNENLWKYTLIFKEGAQIKDIHDLATLDTSLIQQIILTLNDDK